VNGIVKNAREAHMISNNSNVNLKVLNMVNRAQLTPLNMDTYEKTRPDLIY